MRHVLVTDHLYKRCWAEKVCSVRPRGASLQQMSRLWVFSGSAWASSSLRVTLDQKNKNEPKTPQPHPLKNKTKHATRASDAGALPHSHNC